MSPEDPDPFVEERLALSLLHSESQLDILMLVEKAGSPTVLELTHMSGKAASSVSRLRDSLEANGLIAAASDPLDARRKYLSLTEKGKRVLAAVRKRKKA